MSCILMGIGKAIDRKDLQIAYANVIGAEVNPSPYTLPGKRYSKKPRQLRGRGGSEFRERRGQYMYRRHLCTAI